LRNLLQPVLRPENICLFMQSCLTFGNSRILAETLVVGFGNEGKVEEEEDEEAEEKEEEDEGQVQIEGEPLIALPTRIFAGKP